MDSRLNPHVQQILQIIVYLMILWEDFCDLLDVLERPQDQSLRQVLKRLRPHVDPSQETIRTRERLKAKVLPLPLQASSPVECIAVQGGVREADLQRLPHRCLEVQRKRVWRTGKALLAEGSLQTLKKVDVVFGVALAHQGEDHWELLRLWPASEDVDAVNESTSILANCRLGLKKEKGIRFMKSDVVERIFTIYKVRIYAK